MSERWFRCAQVVLLSACGIANAQSRAGAPPAVEVLSAHWIAIHFSPQYPAGRHTQNPLASDGLRLPVPESAQIRGQAGQSSEIHQNEGSYRLPVPDFAADADVDRAVLQATITARRSDAALKDAGNIKLDGVAAPAILCPRELCGSGATLTAYAADLHNLVNPAEFTVELSVNPGESLEFNGGCEGALALGTCIAAPTLFLHTRQSMAKPAGWSTAEQSGLDLPHIHPLFDQFLRDTSIVLAPDGNYYMTGTTGGPEMMVVTSDLSVWKSPDLFHWTPVRDLPRPSTVVWNIDRDGTWMKPITLRDGEPFRPLWAPEIHFIHGTFWIPFSVPRHGVTLLKSTSGKAEGPYEIAIKPDEPVSSGIDASLFQDDDGSVYFLYGGGWIAKLKPDMSGLAEPFRHIASASGREVGFEGVYLFKDHGLYTLCAADFVQGEYNTYVATATSLNGPWSERYLAVPHAGHANFFRDKAGRMWSTFFGNDRHAAFAARPGIVPLVKDARGRWRPDPAFVWPASKDRLEESLHSATLPPGAIGPTDGRPQQVGVMPASK